MIVISYVNTIVQQYFHAFMIDLVAHKFYGMLYIYREHKTKT